MFPGLPRFSSERPRICSPANCSARPPPYCGIHKIAALFFFPFVSSLSSRTVTLGDQAEDLLTSSQLLLAKNEYVQAADAVASAEVLLGDLQQVDAAGGAERRAAGGTVVDKENRRHASTGTGRSSKA